MPTLSSHHHKTLVCLFSSENLRSLTITIARQERFELLDDPKARIALSLTPSHLQDFYPMTLVASEAGHTTSDVKLLGAASYVICIA